MRKAAYAGSFYPASITGMDEMIEKCFLSERGPGALPSKSTENLVKAVVVPHAGYVYSGPAAAWSYKAIAESEFPDFFIIAGPSHQTGQSALTQETFETPYGEGRVDQDFARRLLEKGTIKENKHIHDSEHCIEVQLPFLQFVFKKKLEKIKILPLLLSGDTDLKKLAVDIKEVLLETKKRAVFIASSDFTHYGRNYRYVPFSSDVKKRLYDLDGGVINFIKDQDPDGFMKYVHEKMATICGAYAIELLLRTVNAEKVLLEQFYTSGDITGDYKNSVSYASIVFK